MQTSVQCGWDPGDTQGLELMSCRLILIGFGVIHSENTVRAVSREGDRCGADSMPPTLMFGAVVGRRIRLGQEWQLAGFKVPACAMRCHLCNDT